MLRVALEHFIAQHAPDARMQVDEAGVVANLGHIARARQVDREFADRRVPGPAASTTTRSLMAIASSRSWVMNSTALRLAAHRSSTSFSINWRVWMSSAENGSSIRMMSGSSTSVCARLTRLRMPPESWCG